jgi:hypothetical protein
MNEDHSAKTKKKGDTDNKRILTKEKNNQVAAASDITTHVLPKCGVRRQLIAQGCDISRSGLNQNCRQRLSRPGI